ncbi:MAG TPA: hypothetical protein VM221_09255 [Armatimonadota bacterium]|nr:hypothetical protein [Armatimonadota bacterium]
MNELWRAIYERAAADAELGALVGHSEADRRIKRGYQPEPMGYPCVAYDLWSARMEPVDQAKGNRAPQVVTVRFSVWSPESVVGGGAAGDALLSSIAERLKEVFHGADLTSSGLHSYASHFDDFQSPVRFDEQRRAYTQALRFRFIVKAL